MYMVVHPHVLVGVWPTCLCFSGGVAYMPMSVGVWPTCPCLCGGVAYMPMSLWGCGLHAYVLVGVWPTSLSLSGGVDSSPEEGIKVETNLVSHLCCI